MRDTLPPNSNTSSDWRKTCHVSWVNNFRIFAPFPKIFRSICSRLDFRSSHGSACLPKKRGGSAGSFPETAAGNQACNCLRNFPYFWLNWNRLLTPEGDSIRECARRWGLSLLATEDVQEFPYRGANVDKECGSSKDIMNRLQKADSAIQRLRKAWGASGRLLTKLNLVLTTKIGYKLSFAT